MTRRTLFWKVYPYLFLVIFLSLLLAALYGAREMRSLYMSQVTSTLEARVQLAGKIIAPYMVSGDQNAIQKECVDISRMTNTRFTVIALDGSILGDSHEDPHTMESHANRPEIVVALSGETGIKRRYSVTLQANMMYVASPVRQDGQIIGVLRAAVPVSEVETVPNSFYWDIGISGIIILFLAAIVSSAVLNRVTGPLRDLRTVAGKYASGEFGSRLPVPHTEEIADLAVSMNRMAEQLDHRIRTVAQQRNERDAILSSMSEGLLALDSSEKIVMLNRVAAGILNLSITESRGKAFYEVIRIPALLDFVEEALKRSSISEMEFSLLGKEEKHIQVRAAALKNAAGETGGLVLVFNDITRLKRLESVRRDFVANVSHELRTPITAITGSVETLLHGAADNPEDCRRFINMIARHSERLNNLIKDLMALAKIESQTGSSGVELSEGFIGSIIESSVQACQENSRAHSVLVSHKCEHDLVAKVNRSMLQQAITNLIENAIKYSNAGSAVRVEGSLVNGEVQIAVIDRGVGIAEKHLPRLFERFYRVDEARTRDIGGTGLGLAIVKHIALAHNGKVSVESKIGAGSTFRIHLPTIS